ncbi:hypothetical protein [Bradyrhizobium sp. USDA 4451]
MVAFNRGLASNPAALFGGSTASGLARERATEGIKDSLETKYIAVSLYRADELHTEKAQWRSSPREMNNGRVGGQHGRGQERYRRGRWYWWLGSRPCASTHRRVCSSHRNGR